MSLANQNSKIPHGWTYGKGKSGRLSASTETLHRLTVVVPTSIKSLMETTRQNQHIPGTADYVSNTVPMINSNYDRRDAHRGTTSRCTTPSPQTDPIGFERDVARQLGFSTLRISPIEDSEPSARLEHHRSVSPFRARNDFMVESVSYLSISNDNAASVNSYQEKVGTSSPVRALLGHLSVAPGYCHDDDIPVIDIQIPASKQNLKDPSSPTSGKNSNGQLGLNQKYPPSCHLHQNTEIRLIDVTNEHRRSIRGSQAQNNQVRVRDIQDTLACQNQALDYQTAEDGHGKDGAMHDDAGRYPAQVYQEMQMKNDPAEVDCDGANQHKLPRYTWAHQPNNQVSDKSITLTRKLQLNATHRIDASVNDRRDQYGRLAGELGLPNHLNCAVWIRGIPKEIPRPKLFRELFKHVSVGPIVAAFINEGGNVFSHRAAKVIFKHPQHADRLCADAHFQGIYINGEYLRIELNKYGHREYPDRFHYRSRAIIVQVLNYPSMGLPYWMSFINRLGICDFESTRHLPDSTPEHMVMEFRFARIFGQASKFLYIIKNTASFRGIVTVRYVPDMACDLH
ncbi:hypothetical protein EAF04_002478 [Stromatinia cepivora]|nr:hypothetical protein EAF04_002478 [Stromatinia cepivora]